MQPGLCPIEVHLNPASGRSPAPCQTSVLFSKKVTHNLQAKLLIKFEFYVS
ncbi:hypothetical protein GCM10009085_52910 [Pseudomonas avellanae]|nr:hypothetical protein GCM10009085_52910 [Pseudomonas avellanae]